MSFAIVCCHFNPFGYHEPRRNLLRFLRQMESQRIDVYVSELTYDDEPFFLPASPRYLRYRTSRHNVLWHKENLLNQAVDALPVTVDKVAWIDPDIWFMSQDWLRRADDALDRWSIIQLFSQADWTDRDGRTLWSMDSCAYAKAYRHKLDHPGLAWAARRDLWGVAGGLCDRAILGSADSLLAATCLKVAVPDFIKYPLAEKWMRRTREWLTHVGDLGFIDGRVVHEWHGDLPGRNYAARQQVLVGTNIDAILRRRDDGLLEFADNAPLETLKLIQEYFLMRREDGSAPVARFL